LTTVLHEKKRKKQNKGYETRAEKNTKGTVREVLKKEKSGGVGNKTSPC